MIPRVKPAQSEWEGKNLVDLVKRNGKRKQVFHASFLSS